MDMYSLDTECASCPTLFGRLPVINFQSRRKLRPFVDRFVTAPETIKSLVTESLGAAGASDLVIISRCAFKAVELRNSWR